MILGKPVQITPQVVQDPYYDEEIVQFYYSWDLMIIFIVMIQDRNKVIKHGDLIPLQLTEDISDEVDLNQ